MHRGRRPVGIALRQPGRHPSQHRAHPIRRIVDGEDTRQTHHVLAVRPTEIGDRRGGEHRVRRYLKTRTRLEMNRTPVHLDNPALAAGVSIQSPSLNGCSNSISNPEMICPTEFCNVRPTTIDVTPRAVNNPLTLAPQM